MKQIALSALAAFTAFTSVAQINLEKTYQGQNANNEVILFSNNGRKISSIDKGSNELKLYETNHTLWKTINIQPPAGYQLTNVYAVSDNLFNSDNAIECVAIFTPLTSGTYKAHIVNETGTVIKDLGNVSYAIVRHVGNNTFKLFAFHSEGANGIFNDVYSLPGTMPCDNCGNGLGVSKMNNSGGGGVVAAMPNPANNTVTIAYKLHDGTMAARLVITDIKGQNMQDIQLSNNNSSTTIDLSKYPAGTYYYHLNSPEGSSNFEKFVVIK